MFGKLNNIVTAPHVQCYSHADHACYSVEQRLRSYRIAEIRFPNYLCTLEKQKTETQEKHSQFVFNYWTVYFYKGTLQCDRRKSKARFPA